MKRNMEVAFLIAAVALSATAIISVMKSWIPKTGAQEYRVAAFSSTKR